MKILLKRDLKPKERNYEVTIYVDGMYYPEVAMLEVISTSPKKARKWVLDNLRISAERL